MENECKAMRHELKYLLSYAGYFELRSRIAAALASDENSDGNHEYFIRSLYLDDYVHTAYKEKNEGIYKRKKYRIRTYNYSDEILKLECKEKIGDRICKRSVPIKMDCFCEIQQGYFEGLLKLNHKLCEEVYQLWKLRGLHSDVVVDYDREAYVYPVSNVRITFDKNLHAGPAKEFDFFGNRSLTLPVYPNQNVILEIKYDNVIPEFVRSLLSCCRLVPQAVSKFCICKDMISGITETANSII